MDVAQLQTWLEEGLSLEEIGRRVGQDARSIGLQARQLGLVSTHVGRHAPKGAPSRERIEALVAEGLSIRELAEQLDRGPATVRHWLRTYGRTTAQTARLRAAKELVAGGGPDVDLPCARHGPAPHRWLHDRGYRCLRCRSQYVADRRRRVKAILVEEAGGACVLCGYDRTPRALEFHHLDPETKAFNLSFRGATRSLDKARAEARKCVLLCANCHAEVEAGHHVLERYAARVPSGDPDAPDPR